MSDYKALAGRIRISLNLRSARLHELTAGLNDCFGSAQKELMALAEFLESID